jgi:hypothetical protein
MLLFFSQQIINIQNQNPGLQIEYNTCRLIACMYFFILSSYKLNCRCLLYVIPGEHDYAIVPRMFKFFETGTHFAIIVELLELNLDTLLARSGGKFNQPAVMHLAVQMVTSINSLVGP